MGFYYGDAWDGISEWVDGVGWVDPYDDDNFPELENTEIFEEEDN